MYDTKKKKKERKRKAAQSSDSYKSNDKHIKLLNDDSDNQHININAVIIFQRHVYSNNL